MKKAAAIAAFCAVIFGFLGCGKNSVNPSASKGKEKIRLTVWESANGPDEFIKRAGLAYSKIHPNVEIEFVNVEVGDSSDQILIDGPAGLGPDLFAAPHDKLGGLVTGGLVLETLNPSEVSKEVLGACSQALKYEGKMYGYPVSAETYALFYNKELIPEKEVPKTWEELAEWVRIFNLRNLTKTGFVMEVGSGYYTIIFTTSNSNRLFGPFGTDTSKSYLNNEAAVKGMKFFQSLRAIVDEPASDLSSANCKAAFQSGNAAMFITGLWNVNLFEDAGINFGVAPLPSLPGEVTPAASFSGTRAMFVSSYSKHPSEAADFARFLLTPEMQQLRFNLTGAMPAINTSVSSKYMSGFLKQLDYAFPMPSIPEMTAFWDAMGNASKNIWDGADVQKELDECDALIIK